jgi:hypothetical protein
VPSYLVICPVPVAPPLIPAVAATAEPPRIFATPVPAPASTPPGTSPPSANPAPAQPTPAQPSPAPPKSGVNEAQSFYDAYAAEPRGGVKKYDLVSVGFWNNTSRAVVLRVQGQVQTLPAGRGVTLDLPRQFVWQVDGREAQVLSLPAAQAGTDIVLRR